MRKLGLILTLAAVLAVPAAASAMSTMNYPAAVNHERSWQIYECYHHAPVVGYTPVCVNWNLSGNIYCQGPYGGATQWRCQGVVEEFDPYQLHSFCNVTGNFNPFGGRNSGGQACYPQGWMRTKGKSKYPQHTSR